MPVLSTYASGYRRLYQNDESELRACLGENASARRGGIPTIDPANPEVHWWPGSVDFREEASRHGSAVGVRNFQALLDAIGRASNINQVLWFGHGAGAELQFGGGIRLGSADVMGLNNANVSRHFAPGGTITFYACNAGQSSDFFQAIADALRVRICGFSSGVRWELSYTGESPNRRITRRGVYGGSLPTSNICVTPR